MFLENGGTQLLVDNLRQSGNEIQILYYTLINIWLLSFTTEGVEKFISVPRFGILRLICELLQKLSREKLTRVSFMIFKNVQENHTCLELMMDSRLLKIIDTLLKGNIKDEDLIDSIKDIGSVLESNIRILSSFDKYIREITNENLEWSSVHTERFWKENAIKFENNDFQVIKYNSCDVGNSGKCSPVETLRTSPSPATIWASSAASILEDERNCCLTQSHRNFATQGLDHGQGEIQ